MANGFWKGTTVLLAVVAAGAGGFARWTMLKAQDAERASSACNGQLSQCAVERADARAQAEKELASASESLGATRAELEELRAERAENEKRLAAFRSLTEKFRKMIDSGKLQVVLVHGRMVVKLPAGVLFPSGSAELSKEGKDALKDVASVLRGMRDRRFMVAGHTDNVPVVPPSTFKNNLELSTARAVTVAQHLTSSGMSANQLVAAGYSEHEPVRPNTNEAGRQENRRIEIVLLPNVTELPSMPGEAKDAGAPHAVRADAGTTAAPTAPAGARDAGASVSSPAASAR